MKVKPDNSPAVRLASAVPAVPPQQPADHAALSADPRQRLMAEAYYDTHQFFALSSSKAIASVIEH